MKARILTLFSVLTLLFIINTDYKYNSIEYKYELNIVYRIDSSSKNGKYLITTIENNTQKNLVLAPLLTWRKMFGPDQCTHINLFDDLPSTSTAPRVNCISMNDSTPIIYIGTEPAINKDWELHLEAKNIMAKSGKWLLVDDLFSYILDNHKVPKFVFIGSRSSLTFRFRIKDTTKGEYSFSVLSVKDRDNIRSLKRGFDYMELILEGGVKGYEFYDGDYYETPLEVVL